MKNSSNLLKIAVLQLTSTSSVESNFKTICSLISEAAKSEAAIAFLPENFHYMRTPNEPMSYEPLTGPTMSSYKDLARNHKIWLSLGGFQEQIISSKKFFNTHVVIDNEGEIKGIYRKIHLFDVEIDPTNTVKESQYVEPGEITPVVIDSPIGRMGLSICYDIRFPELYRKQALEKNADILTIPAAFLQPTGKAHWEILLRARAIENTCFVIAAAQCGQHNENRKSYGHSMVVDPWGQILLDMKEEVGVGFVELDLMKIEEVRKKLPCLKHAKIN